MKELTFKQLLIKSMIVGLIAGGAMCIAQVFLLNPVIFEAETFENSSGHDHSHGSGETEEEWAPEDGYERLYFTFVASILTGLGFSAVLLALISHFQLSVVHHVKPSVIRYGALWGVGGFIVFFLAPSIGLPPEIPGMERAVVENRQLWWFFCMLCVAISLLVIAFSKHKFRFSAALLILVPYIIGAPELSGGGSFHPDPEIAQAQQALQSKFTILATIANFTFWLLAGLGSVWAVRKYFYVQSELATT